MTETDADGLGCMSYDFCSENVECISAWELLSTRKLRQNESYFFPLKEVCLSLGMKESDFNRFMDYEIMTDFLLTNTDRHMNNISTGTLILWSCWDLHQSMIPGTPCSTTRLRNS